MIEDRVDIDAAGEILRVTKSTLYRWRADGYGPRSVKFAGRLWYNRDDCYRFRALVEAETARGTL